MHIYVNSLVDVKTAPSNQGKYLSKQVRCCFVSKQALTLDFEGLQLTSQRFFQELFLPLVAEFGAEFISANLSVINLNAQNTEIMKMAFNNLDNYFEQLMSSCTPQCNAEIFDMNLSWLFKARELSYLDPLQAELVMGIADENLRLAISQLTMEDIQRLAKSGWLCFAPRFNAKFIHFFTC